jgi:hypothetical protein
MAAIERYDRAVTALPLQQRQSGLRQDLLYLVWVWTDRQAEWSKALSAVLGLGLDRQRQSGVGLYLLYWVWVWTDRGSVE